MKSTQVFHNAKWIIICKVVQSLLQFVVGMLCARYLGPANYGLINYASSIVAFALPVMKLGFDATLVRELVERPDKEKEVMGTSLLLNIISSLVCMLGVFGFVSVMNYGEPITIIVCVLYSISVFCAALEMVQYWFQYKLISKYSSIVMLVAYVVVSAYRIILLATQSHLYFFALTNALDFGLIGSALIVIYVKLGGRFSFSGKLAKEMLSRSKFYVIAALMVIVIQNTDHIMITKMIGEAENGFYSAAITCCSIPQFVYTAIIDSYRPLILSKRKESRAAFEEHMAGLYCIINYLVVAQCIVYFIFAKPIMMILYGSEFAEAVPVLRVLVGYCIFSHMGTVRNVWILAEEKQKYLWGINLTGALFNIVLNAFLIPVWGACGAAFASFLTQFFTNFILGFIFKPMRQNNKLIIKGLNPKTFIKVIKTVTHMKEYK